MRQRVVIAIALACDPQILIADEPTTGARRDHPGPDPRAHARAAGPLGMSIILITHDLGVVASTAHRVAVMYGGRIVETGTVREIFYNPQMPYTWGLLASIPLPTADRSQELIPIPGTPPDALDPPKGCPFTARCPYAMKSAATRCPSTLRSLGAQGGLLAAPRDGPGGRATGPSKGSAVTDPGGERRPDGSANGQALLQVKDLKKHFSSRPRSMLKAVDGISLEINKGETFGLVGESGCGKSTAGRTLIRLYEPSGGQIVYKARISAGRGR
jgi:peptide/nickel transport system ATP-binding protein